MAHTFANLLTPVIFSTKDRHTRPPHGTSSQALRSPTRTAPVGSLSATYVMVRRPALHQNQPPSFSLAAAFFSLAALRKRLQKT